MPFKLPQFTVCCCGCSLRTGVYIIAVINILLFILIEAASITSEIRVMAHRPISRLEFLENDLFDLTLFARIVLAICLLYGCYKDNPSYMLGFFMMQAVFIILYVIFALMFLFIHIMGVPSQEIFILTIGSVIQGYSALIVYSHYRNLKEGRSISI